MSKGTEAAIRRMFEMTLDEAIDAFRDDPSDYTGVNLRFKAQQYEGDGMITEQEMWDLIAWTDGGPKPDTSTDPAP